MKKTKNGNESIMVTITFFHFFSHFIFGFGKMDILKMSKIEKPKNFWRKKITFFY